jgi:hypothetical protein
MTNVLELAGGVSIAVKVGWAILLLWTAGQVYWYRQAREVVLPPMKPESRRSLSHRGHDGNEHGVPI